MSIIFLATSPLHIIISTLIASTFEKNTCNLILCGKEKQRIQNFNSLISTWSESPFQEVYPLVKAKNPKDFINLVEKLKPTEVIAGNDLVPEFFALAHLAKRYSFSLSYMDDGLHSYIEYKKKIPSQLAHSTKNLIRQFSKGYKKPFPHTLGSSPLTKKAYLFFPDLAKKNIQSKDCTYISINREKKNLLKSFGWQCIKKLNIKLPDTDKNVALFVLPHFSRITYSIEEDFKRAIKSSINDGLTIILKNHPSNDDRLLLELMALSKKSYVIPKSIPVELIICCHPPHLIMGGLSSIFLSTKALASNSRFSLVGDDISCIPNQLSDFLIPP